MIPEFPWCSNFSPTKLAWFFPSIFRTTVLYFQRMRYLRTQSILSLASKSWLRKCQEVLLIYPVVQTLISAWVHDWFFLWALIDCVPFVEARWLKSSWFSSRCIESLTDWKGQKLLNLRHPGLNLLKLLAWLFSSNFLAKVCSTVGGLSSWETIDFGLCLWFPIVRKCQQMLIFLTCRGLNWCFFMTTSSFSSLKMSINGFSRPGRLWFGKLWVLFSMLESDSWRRETAKSAVGVAISKSNSPFCLTTVLIHSTLVSVGNFSESRFLQSKKRGVFLAFVLC